MYTWSLSSLQVVAEKESQCAMAIEEARGRRAYFEEEVANMQGQIKTLQEELSRLGGRLIDEEHQRREMEEYKQSELDVSRDE